MGITACIVLTSRRYKDEEDTRMKKKKLELKHLAPDHPGER